MYRRISDFISDWAYESGATVKIFEAIPEDKRSEKLNENMRTLDRLAWHITQTIPEMAAKAGLIDEDHLEDKPIPDHTAEIVKEYLKQSEDLKKAVESKWKDEELEQKKNMYGNIWEKGKMLSIIIRHQAHHRAQMTTLIRLLGGKVPGVYGPSKEEWSTLGVPAME